MAKHNFGKIEAIKYGFGILKKNLWFFVSLFILTSIINSVPSMAGSFFEEGDFAILGFLLTLVSWGLQLAISMGLIGIALRLHDKKKAEYRNLFDYFHLIIPYLFASILYGLIVVGGFILFVIPGIIWSVKFRYFSYFMVDKKMGPIEALKASAKITDGNKWNLFLFSLLIVLLNLAGLLALIVGIIFTSAISMMAEAHVFRKLQGSK